MRHRAKLFFAYVLCAVFFLAEPASLSLAQSGAELQAWRRWCRSIGGTHNNDANNPVCTPGPGSSSQRRTRDDIDTFLPPDPLPGLVGEYRAIRGWFRSDFFPDAPAAIEPRSLPDLYFALDRLAQFSQRKLDSLRAQKADLETRYRELQIRLAQNRDASDLLKSEFDRLEIEIAATNREIQTATQDLAAQNASNDQIANVIGQIENEARNTRADLFKTLYDAAEQRLIHVPSTYQPLPRPVAPQYRPNQPQSGSPGLASAGPAPASALNWQTAGPTASFADTTLVESITEGTVRRKIEVVRNLIPQIRTATADANAAYQRVQSSEQALSSSSNVVTTLRSDAEKLRLAASTASLNLTVARDRLSEAVGKYNQLRDRFPVKCLELGLWKYYRKQVKQLVKELAPDVKEVRLAVNTKGLTTLVKVMRHVVELNNQTLNVADRAAGALAFGGVEDVEALIRELDDVVGRFNANLFNDLTGKKLLKYKRDTE